MGRSQLITNSEKENKPLNGSLPLGSGDPSYVERVADPLLPNRANPVKL